MSFRFVVSLARTQYASSAATIRAGPFSRSKMCLAHPNTKWAGGGEKLSRKLGIDRSTCGTRQVG
jgi:hypothetical protein